MEHRDAIRLIMDYFEPTAEIIFCDCSLERNKKSPKADVIFFNKASGWTIVECKVEKAPLAHAVRHKEHEKYLPFCNLFYYACPKEFFNGSIIQRHLKKDICFPFETGIIGLHEEKELNVTIETIALKRSLEKEPLKRDPDMNEIGLIIKNLRGKKKLRPVDLAGLSGVSLGTIHKTEAGKSLPSLKNLDLICKALGIEASALIQQIEGQKK